MTKKPDGLMAAIAKEGKRLARKGVTPQAIKDYAAGKKVRTPKKPPAKVAKKPKQSGAAAREFRLRNVKI